MSVFEEVVLNHCFDIEIMESTPDYAPVFLFFPSQYSFPRGGRTLKSLNASVISRECQRLRNNNGVVNFVRTDTLSIP